MAMRSQSGTGDRQAVVLVLDDDPNVGEFVRATLPGTTYRVVWKRTSEDAIRSEHQGQAAAQVSVALQGPGFSVADRGTASSKVTQSLIRYAPGDLDKAQLLQRYLQNGARLVSDPSLRTVDVALVVGPDYAGVRDKPATVPPSTTPTTVSGKSSPTTTIPSC